MHSRKKRADDTNSDLHIDTSISRIVSEDSTYFQYQKANLATRLTVYVTGTKTKGSYKELCEHDFKCEWGQFCDKSSMYRASSQNLGTCQFEVWFLAMSCLCCVSVVSVVVCCFACCFSDFRKKISCFYFKWWLYYWLCDCYKTNFQWKMCLP